MRESLLENAQPIHGFAPREPYVLLMRYADLPSPWGKHASTLAALVFFFGLVIGILLTNGSAW